MTSISKLTSASQQPPVKAVCDFLSDYAGLLFSCGSTCIRLEKNVTRMAAAFGTDVRLFIMPHHIHITVTDRSGQHLITSIANITEHPISFDINTRLSKLSWDIADGKIGFDEALREFKRISRTRPCNKWWLLLLVSLANASFCRLFGGDLTAMAVVFVATFAGFNIKQLLTERHLDFRLIVLVCSFVSSVLAAADGLFGLGSTPGIAIGTSVLYLVPGIPFINSFCDMMDRHYICAFGRVMNALVITGCLSVGLGCGMMVMNVGMF